MASPRYVGSALPVEIVEGGSIAPVRVVTTTNITVAGSAPNTYDGVALAANDRILLAGQTVATENGLYIVSVLGGGVNGTWIRSPDGNLSEQYKSAMPVWVSEGDLNKRSLWYLATANPITLGVTNLSFIKYQNFQYKSVNMDYNLDPLDSEVGVDSSGAPRNITLPLVTTVTPGRLFFISDITGSAAANNITLTANPANTIVGGPTLVLNKNNAGVIIGPDANTAWFVYGSFNLATGFAASGANSDITSMSGLTGAISKPTTITVGSGGGLRTDTGAGNTALLQAYDTMGAAYTTFATLTANNTPTMDLAAAVTKGGAALVVAGANSNLTDLTGLTGAIAKPTSMTLATGGSVRTDTGAGNTAFLQAYDTMGATYTTFATLTANNTPTFDLSDSTTKGGGYIYRQGGTQIPPADIHLDQVWSFTASVIAGALLSAQGGLKLKRTATAIDYTILTTDVMIGCTTAAAPRTITLPPAATAGTDRIYVIKDESGASSGGNSIVVQANGLENIDGANTKIINTNYGSITIYCDGSNWFII